MSARVLNEYESKKLLEEYDIPVADGEMVNDCEEALSAIEEIGLPVVMKVVSKDIQHKSDIGAVKKVHSWDDIEKVYFDLIDAVEERAADSVIEGVIVEELVAGDEFILGVNKDAQFGHVIMFGLGGIYVEVFKDTVFRVLPIDDYDVETMVDDLKSKDLLEGARNREKVDLDKLKKIFFNVSKLVEKEDIKELDINPLIIEGNNIKVADALIIVAGDK